MGLEITLSLAAGRTWFTAGETVCGTVHWTNKRSTAVSRVTVHLEGETQPFSCVDVDALLTEIQVFLQHLQSQ